MTDLQELITNIELCSSTDGSSTITFPTLKKLSVSDVVTIWSSVSKHVQQQLLQRKPRAVRVPGLGTFLIKKWLSFENGEVLTFQRPLFVLSRTVAQIRELQHASVPVPDDMKKVSVSWKKIHSDVPYSEEVVQNCMQETLKYFCFILRNRKDTDFILKDLGTLAIRGTEVTMAFCKDFLLRLNKSTYVVEKLLAKKLVISDKEVTLSLSHFGHVYQLPQFEARAVPRRMYLTDEEICIELERALSSMGIREESLQTAEAWIQGRRQLRTELESFGDIERWLTQKPSKNDQEKRYWERTKARRADRRAVVQSAVTHSLDSKDSPREWKENTPDGGSGDGPVDEHCLPSTVESDLGELVDRYRRNAVTSYLETSKRCKERNVHITNPTLQKALLHPGDKIIKEGQDIGKIRQPGGYYSTGRADAGSTCRSGSASRSQMEAEKRFVQRGLQMGPLLLPSCLSPLCAQSPRRQRQYRARYSLLHIFFFPFFPPPFLHRHLQTKKTQKSNDNNFWPGHLLDKLCLYFPEKQHDRAHALFSCVQPTRPAYRGT
ncbi:LOW QUALITY PROTEIN: uncharacterized protein LOC142598418 [Balearica regulorum gibbericeps]|uniref:LOW QUALITY PROTEIN: uncharacterized protein LOC142598418 n=1 Tax=Balearica regulorum gibbericeps TaxID=100784 RepID=UPI003F5D61F9